MTMGEPAGEVFLGNALQDMGSIGSDTLNTIDHEVEVLVSEAERRAHFVLEANWAIVRETATSLLEFETLSGHALDALLAGVIETPIDTIPLAPRTLGDGSADAGRGDTGPAGGAFQRSDATS